MWSWNGKFIQHEAMGADTARSPQSRRDALKGHPHGPVRGVRCRDKALSRFGDLVNPRRR